MKSYYKCSCGRELPIGEFIVECPCGEVFQFVATWNQERSRRVKSWVERWVRGKIKFSAVGDILDWLPSYWFEIRDSSWHY